MSPDSVDLAFVGGSVVTMDRHDSIAEALGVSGSRISIVGTREEVLNAVRPDAVIIDLGGNSLIPGFIDNHIHMANAWQRRWEDISYPRCQTILDIVDVMQAAASKAPDDTWVVGRGFEAERLVEGRPPSRHDLDASIPHHRVALCNREGMGWTFNTLGLRAIGVQDDTPDPPGGPLERDSRGRPLGPMWDNARTYFIVPNMPKPPDHEVREGFSWIQSRLLQFGVTTAHEAGYKEARHVRLWAELQESRPGLRVILGPYPLVGSSWDSAAAPAQLFESGVSSGFGSELLKFGAVQMGVDGGLIGRTAALFAPYDDRADGYMGSFRVSQETLDEHVRRANDRNWQVGLICQGDAGISRSLHAIERLGDDRRDHHRLEHAYLWRPELLEMASTLRVVWNTQPSVLPLAGPYLNAMFGERARWAFPFRSALSAGVTVSGGSDWPVGPLDPLLGIDALVNHRADIEGTEAFNADQTVSVLDAFRIYTLGGAVAGLEADAKGSLESGKLADLVVLNKDIATANPSDIKEMRVVETYVGGVRVFRDDRNGTPAH